MEDLADHHPRGRTPRRGEDKGVDADEDDEHVHGDLGFFHGDADDGDHEFTDRHAHGAPDEERSTAEALDGPEGDRGADDIDGDGTDGDEEWIGDVDFLEKRRVLERKRKGGTR